MATHPIIVRPVHSLEAEVTRPTGLDPGIIAGIGIAHHNGPGGQRFIVSITHADGAELAAVLDDERLDAFFGLFATALEAANDEDRHSARTVLG